MTRDEVFNVLSIVVLVLPFIDWAAVVILLRALRRRPELATLRDRFYLALGIAALTSMFAVLALVRFGILTLPGDVIGVVLTAIVTFLTLVNLAFIWRYWRYAL